MRSGSVWLSFNLKISPEMWIVMLFGPYTHTHTHTCARMYTFVFTHLRVNEIAATLKRCCVSEGCCNEDHRGREPDKAPPPPAFWPLILPCGVLMSAQLQRHCSGHCLKVHVWKHVYTQRCVTSNKSELVLCCSFSQEAGVSVLIHLQCVCVGVCMP